MKPKHLYIIAISWLVLTVVFCFSLTKGEQSICQEINRAFREAIDRHYAERVEIFQRFHTPDLNPYAEYYITAPICGHKIKSYELRTWNSTTLFVFKDSTDETKARRLLNEHILAQANPIDTDKLNTLLQARLASEGITGNIKAQAWADYDSLTSARHIDTHIKNLRKALKPFPSYQIVTVRGKGYYLNEE